MKLVLVVMNVRKQARGELKGLILETKKRTAKHRRVIAALKREMATFRRRFDGSSKRLPDELALAAKGVSKSRFRVDGLKAHRLRLGLSAAGRKDHPVW